MITFIKIVIKKKEQIGNYWNKYCFIERDDNI